MKFGEVAAERFLSGQSPIAQHGKAVVGSSYTMNSTVMYYTTMVYGIVYVKIVPGREKTILHK